MMDIPNKTVLKVFAAAALISVIIYSCGELSLLKKEKDKYQNLEADIKEAKDKKDAKSQKKEQEKKEPVKPKVERVEFPKIEFPDGKSFERKRGISLPNHTYAKSGALYTIEDGKVLWAKKANNPVPIASMTKMLTVLVALEEIKSKEEYTMQTEVEISASSRKTGSSSFLRRYPGKKISLEKLMQSAMVKSANDSCQLMAEFFGKGNPQKFIAKMNIRARKLGMTKARFFNSHGLPGNDNFPKSPDNTCSASELSLVIAELFNHKEVFSWTSRSSITYFAGTSKAYKIFNTNRILKRMKGCFGIKTGFTYNAGQCVTLGWKINGKTYICIIAGCRRGDRDKLALQIYNWSAKTVN